MNLFYKVNQIDELLINNGLRYTIVSSDSKDGEYKEVDTGDFTGVSNHKLKILNTEIESNKTVYYRVYLWLDTNAGNQVAIQNSVLDVELNGKINQAVNQPILDDGMVPVVIYEDGTVMTTNENDLDWYDYEKQKWANIVLVNENASSSEGSKSREYYLNNPGTEVLESDILAYYVWIPRYKYKIWTTGVSSTGEEQSIEIVFESLKEPISLGTSVGEYRTHPAFWWDNDNDSVYDEGEMLPGIWVGKFETTGDGTIPTVKPNTSSLVNQNVSTQFTTSLLFAGGSMNTTTGKVTFGNENIYKLTIKTDSHMMKNSEWGAVAYLSHSVYGINEEVRINNYYNNGTLTGCGALTKNEAQSTTCGIEYGNPSTENNTYPQSTTGNITGIFDMSGGSWEVIMGNYNKTTGNSEFIVFPESKYYDLYTTTDISTACNGGICYGQALSESNNWYSDLLAFLLSDNQWLYRGTTREYEGTAGLFAYSNDSGKGSLNYAFRSVLIPNNNYTLTFNANGGILSEGQSSKNIAFGFEYGELPIPTKDNYAFDGWYTQLDGGEKINSDTIVNIKNNQTLYAHWKPINMNISYSVNGGTIKSSTTSVDGNTTYAWTTNDDDMIHLNGQLYRSNISGIQTINLPNYNDSNFMNITREKYGVVENAEWICLSGCKSNGLIFNQEVTYSVSVFCDGKSVDCNVVLGVNWTQQYTITYNLNGGTGEIESQIKAHGVPTNLTNDIPEKEGYSFLGWSTENDATSAIYESGAEYTDNRNITLYAVWKDSTKPTAQIMSTNNVAIYQTVTLTMGDTLGVTNYYFGKENPETTSVTWTNVELAKSVIKEDRVDSDGIWYLGVKDAAGNMLVVNKAFYKTILSINNATVTPTNVITMSGNTFIIPTAKVNTNYTFQGWYMDSDFSGSAITSYTPVASSTLYGKVTGNNLSGGSVSIIGNNIVGSTLTANVTDTSPVGTYSYQWWTATSATATTGTAISGATSQTFTLTNNEVGKYVGVTLTASKENYFSQTFNDITDATANKTAITKIIATIPLASSYCKTLTYNGSSQTLTNSAGTGYTFSNNTGTNAGIYDRITATLSTNYIWDDLSVGTKTISCSIAKKAVTITAGTKSKVYDGTALTYSTCSGNTLVSGHTPTCTMTSTSTITNVGSVNNVISTVVIKSGSTDVTSNYTITNANGKLTVTNGTLSGGSVSIVGNNIVGSTLTANVTDTSPVGTYSYQWWTATSATATSGTAISGATSQTFTLTNNEVGKYVGVTVTASQANYASKTFNDITDATANKTAITKIIATKPDASYCNSLTYTGASQTLVKTAGTGYTWTAGTTRTNAGSQNVTATLSTNYIWDDLSIGTKTISCSIAKKAVTITAGTKSKVYDGTALTYSTCSGNTLVSGHTPTCTMTSTSTITNVGSVNNVISTVVIKSGSTDVTSNYTITNANGKLTVTNATLSGGSVSITGNNTVGSTLTAFVTDTSPAGTYSYQWWTATSATATTGTAISGATSKTYKLTSNEVGKYVGVTVTASQANYASKTFNDITDATANKIAITKHVATKPDTSYCYSLTYTGATQTLVKDAGTGYTWTAGTTRTNAGSQSVTATLSTNYIWNDYSTGTQTISCSISKKAVTITAGTKSKVYDGTALTYSTCTGDTLVSGHAPTCTMTSASKITNVGSVDNVISTVVIKSGSTDVTSNYTITNAKGKLTVTNGSLTGGSVSIEGNNTVGSTLTANVIETDQKVTYSYVWWTSTSATATSGTAISGATSQTFTLTNNEVGKYVGVTVTASQANYTSKTFSDITDATANKTAITKIIATKPNTSYCNSLTYTGASQTLVKTAGTGYTWTAGTTRTDAGSQNVTATLSTNYIWDDLSTGTQTISCSISKKAVTITAKDQTIEYGSSIATGTGQITYTALASGHSITAVTLKASTASVTNDGIITPSAATIKSGSTDVTSNYNISYVNGKLIIKKTNTATLKYYNNLSTTSSCSSSTSMTCSATLPSSAPASPSGYTFNGWSISETCNASTAYVGTSVSLSANATYYACYSKEVTATFYYSTLAADSYTYSNGLQTSTTAKAIQYNSYKGTIVNSNYTIPDAVKNSTGGASAQNYVGVASAVSSATTVTPTTANTKFYAVYTENLTFYYYNGSNHTSTAAVRRMLSNGTSYSNSFNVAVPSPSAYDGASFVAWSYDSTQYSTDYRRVPLETGVNTLYAIYQKTLTVSYNANNGSGAPASHTGTKTYVSKNGGVNTYNPSVTISTTVPTRSGYTFNGWNTAANGSGTSYTKGTAYTISANLTLYAQWLQNYTITYNMNGGTGSIANQTKVHGTSIKLSTTVPTRVNYKFLGWSTSSSATNSTYGAGSDYTANASATLYAVWQSVSPMTVSFNTNGGKFNVNESISYTTPGEYEFIAPYDGEYQLEVWGAQGGNADSYSGGYGGYSSGIISLTKNRKLYVNIAGIGESDCVTRDCLGGYNGGGNGAKGDSLTYQTGGGGATHIAKSIGLLSSLSNELDNILIVAGGGGGASYHKLGTNYSANGGSGGGYLGNDGILSGSGGYNAGGGGTQTEGGEAGHYGNGGSFGQGGNGISSGTNGASGGGGGYYGGGASEHSSPGGGSGYIGNSLLTNKVMYCYNCTTSDKEDTLTYTTTNVSSEPISNYAKSGDGAAKITLQTITEQQKTVNYNIAYGDLPIPTRQNYTFLGWYTSATGGSKVTSTTLVQTDVNHTLYARWQELPKYTITYNANGGSNAPSSQIKYEGETLKLTTSAPIRSGYYLVGWSTDPNATSATYAPGAEYTTNASLTLYAVWKIADPVTSYSCANGSVGSEPYVITYTGDCTVIDDGDGNWRVKFLTNGTFVTASSMKIDAFLVGGGGGGGQGDSKWGSSGGGGGGGYTITSMVNIEKNIEYTITIGAGGAPSSTGGSTKAFSLTAKGGGGAGGGTGGTGGSGGGGGAYQTDTGGSGGSNGSSGTSISGGASGGGGGNSTYEFGDASLTLYAGGGGGGSKGSGGSGGKGGGARGSSTGVGNSATANTGGGGGGGSSSGSAVGGSGGSGIVVIRNSKSTCSSEYIPNGAFDFTYTGNCEVIDDGSGNWRIKFLTSGTFATTSSIKIDAFLVGGGGGGGQGDSTWASGGGGGGGGYTITSMVNIEKNIEYTITIGAGGAPSSTGGSTKAFSLTAKGGGGAGGGTGGTGGSGGGGGAYQTDTGGKGGSNGSSGTASSSAGGGGGGNTTYEFGDSSLTLYSGGGGGGSKFGGRGGSGGAGGGAVGSASGVGSSAASNTGGGGGGGSSSGSAVGGNGGSGIVVIRNSKSTCSSENIPNNSFDFTYTGDCEVINDGDGDWRIKFLTSGTFKIDKDLEIDTFLVGGGGGGGGGDDGNGQYGGTGGGGGGGGYVSSGTVKLGQNINYEIIVGNGGNPSSAGEKTTAFNLSASGGSGAGGGTGGTGGSGGGGGGYFSSGSGGQGGSNGSSGSSSSGAGGGGSGNTTYEFGDSSLTLYSGGGGGGSDVSGGAGGAGGGGKGGTKSVGSSGGSNTGGGGGGGASYGDSSGGSGGSGIVVIRNKR